MQKVKYFKTKPELVEAMVFSGKNGKEICAWVCKFAKEYNLEVKNGGSYVNIVSLDSGLEWRATKRDWIIRSIESQYFYVETASVMHDLYIQV